MKPAPLYPPVVAVCFVGSALVAVASTFTPSSSLTSFGVGGMVGSGAILIAFVAVNLLKQVRK